MLKKILINSSLKRVSSFSLNQFNKQSSLFNNDLNLKLNYYFQYLIKLTKLSDYQINLNYQNKINYQLLSIKMAPNTNETTKTTSLNDDIICKFGVLTDAQYANIGNRAAWYDENKTRYYKDALTHLKKAFNTWSSEMKQKPTFVLQLGDLIDGLNTEEEECNSLDALEQTFKIFEEYSEIPTFHAVGNHELYNFSRSDIALLFRETLIKRGKINPDLVHLQLDFHDLSDENMLLYYSFIPQNGIKVIALDCFDISIIGHDQNDAKYKTAEEILRKHNHSNFDLWDFDTHLEGLNKRFQTQNGGLSDNQLMWLRNELEESKRKNEKVICFGHTCVHPDSCDASCLLYNYDQVIEIFNQYKNQVICYLSGHAHKAGYVSENGIHYLVLHGIIETSPDQDAFSTITIKKNKLIVEGRGVEQSLILPINNETVSNDEINTSNESNDKFTEYEEQLPSSIVEVSV